MEAKTRYLGQNEFANIGIDLKEFRRALQIKF